MSFIIDDIINNIQEACNIIYPYLFTSAIVLLLISLYHLYKKRITYGELPIIFIIVTLLFDVYCVILYFSEIKIKEEGDLNIVFPLEIIQLCVELFIIIIFLLNLSQFKIHFFMLSLIFFFGIIALEVFAIMKIKEVRYLLSIGFSIRFLGAIESIYKIKESKNAYAIPIETTISLILFNLVFFVAIFNHNLFQLTTYFGGLLGMGANMDVLFTYVKTFSKEIKGEIIKQEEVPKEEKPTKENENVDNPINVNESDTLEQNLLNNQI